MTEIEVRRSDRRTLALQVKDGRVIVLAPRRTPEARIRQFIAAHEAWIAKTLAAQQRRAEAHPEPTEAEKKACIARAKEVLPGRVAHYSRIMGLYPTQLRITGAKTRFGSCSNRGHICFSWRLMLYPPEAIDYVVVHELAHLKHMNHSPAFHALVESVLPDHKARRALLRK